MTYLSIKIILLAGLKLEDIKSEITTINHLSIKIILLAGLKPAILGSQLPDIDFQLK